MKKKYVPVEIFAKGGRTTFERYGSEYMSDLGKKSWEARKKKRGYKKRMREVSDMAAQKRKRVKRNKAQNLFHILLGTKQGT